VNLFAPLPGSATAQDAAQAEPERAQAEPDQAGATTPIFDDMLSAWFDAAKPLDASSEETPPENASFAGQTGWRFAADDGWRAADSVTQARPEAYTPAGLPKRQPKARLLPGSANGSADGSASPTSAPRAPAGPGAAKIRRRLSGFQRGVQKGRHQIDVDGVAEPDWPAAGSDSAFFTEEPPEPQAEPEISGEPIEAPVSTVEDEPAPVASTNTEAAVNADSLEDTAIWPTAADEGWEAAEEALTPTPSAFTPAGLPRRKPRAQLVPGSVATKGTPAMAGAGVDAGVVRDRLNSFQRGVRQGRDGSAAADGIEHGFEWEND
jgi:hypothetical protein